MKTNPSISKQQTEIIFLTHSRNVTPLYSLFHLNCRCIIAYIHITSRKSNRIIHLTYEHKHVHQYKSYIQASFKIFLYTQVKKTQLTIYICKCWGGGSLEHQLADLWLMLLSTTPKSKVKQQIYQQW